MTVLCTGNFTDPADKIVQVPVALRYSDPGNSYIEEGHLVFTTDKQQLPWIVDLRNAQLRDYQYKYSIIYAGGVVKNFPADGTWFTGQPGFITVGEKYSLAVDVYPTLLTFNDQAKIVQVDLTYDDDTTDTHQTDSLVFNQTANTVRSWRVRGNPGGTKSFSYRISYFAANGTVTTTDPVAREGEALVIPPPVVSRPRPRRHRRRHPLPRSPSHRRCSPPTPPVPTPPPPPVPTPPAPVPPVTPTPVTPTPFQPTPVQPTPVQPTPVVPTPVTPVTPIPPGQ